MIKGFGCKDTKKVWNGVATNRWNTEIINIALRKLFMLNAAHTINDLRVPPSNRLHPLKGALKGCYSISINMQWRIIFMWENNDAYSVKITDYH